MFSVFHHFSDPTIYQEKKAKITLRLAIKIFSEFKGKHA